MPNLVRIGHNCGMTRQVNRPHEINERHVNGTCAAPGRNDRDGGNKETHTLEDMVERDARVSATQLNGIGRARAPQAPPECRRLFLAAFGALAVGRAGMRASVSYLLCLARRRARLGRWCA